MAYRISKECTKCGACLPECPTGAIISGRTQFHIDADNCADHAACVSVCPVDAISLMPAPKFSNARADEGKEEEE